jgi:hypothetical protein
MKPVQMALNEVPIVDDSRPFATPNREAVARGGHQVTVRGAAGVEFDDARDLSHE